MTSPVEDLAAGARAFGRYEMGPRIARGGMGTVYHARAVEPDGRARSYALKVIHPHLADDPRLLQMFFREARLLGRLRHPNVCAVVDFGEAHGSPFLALEYLDGATLAQLLRRAPGVPALPVELAVRIVADAARGLHAAHELRGADGRNVGVVHRDVSPQNLFVTRDGVTKVLDFGIARSDDEASLTQTGDLKGKIEYMAPEQIDHRPIDRRADVFALGIVLWEATTGMRLYRRGSAPETLLAITTQPAPPPSSAAPDYPPDLEDIVMRTLARAPADRFASAAELCGALEGWLTHAALDASPARLGAYVRTHRGPSRVVSEVAPGPTPFHPPDTLTAASVDDAATTADPRSDVWTRRRRSRAPWIALGLGAVCALAIGVTARTVALRHPPPVAPRAVRSQPPAPAAPEHALAPPPPPAPAIEPPAPAVVLAPPPIASPHHDEHAATHAHAAAARAEGYLDLMALPQAARVYEGSRVLGLTPMVHHALSAGSHTLRLAPEAGGASRDVVVVIRPSALTRAVVRW